MIVGNPIGFVGLPADGPARPDLELWRLTEPLDPDNDGKARKKVREARTDRTKRRGGEKSAREQALDHQRENAPVSRGRQP